jgi:uncharacterized membrane protein
MSGFQIFLVLLYLFFFGSAAGWVLELFFRRFFSGANPERKWLNPGFLFGPCVPLYGFGTVALFALSSFESSIFGVWSGSVWYYIAMFLIMALVMTLIEFAAGILSLKVMHLRLWDYSGAWGNVLGIICPKFTLVWGLLSAAYYFLLYPPLRRLVVWFIAHPLFSFIVGVCFGVFLIDFAFSLHLGTLLRKKAMEIDKTLYESVDLQAYQRKMQLGRGFFRIRPLRSLTDRVEGFAEFLHRRPESPEAK